MAWRIGLMLGVCMAALAAGCTPQVHLGDDDAGPGGVACGRNVCAVGQVCCNASCGICTAPDEGCVALFCEDTDGGASDGGPSACVVSGCSGQICADRVVDSSCEWLPEYACYTSATCTPQASGACGWTQTPELLDCIARARDGGVGCTTNADCGATSYCRRPPDAACSTATGVCEARPEGCAAVYDPVCGCDGSTYGNACSAASAGVNVASVGECGACSAQDAHGVGACEAFFGYYWDGTRCFGASGCSCAGADCGRGWSSPAECMAAHAACGAGEGESCGGLGGRSCASGLFCKFGPDCGAADAPGTCTRVPEACDLVFAPVCGCDGVTYDNECAAGMAGVSVAATGECTVGEDCRVSGCGPGQYCTLCWAGWACIPEGAVC